MLSIGRRSGVEVGYDNSVHFAYIVLVHQAEVLEIFLYDGTEVSLSGVGFKAKIEKVAKKDSASREPIVVRGILSLTLSRQLERSAKGVRGFKGLRHIDGLRSENRPRRA